MIRAVTGFSRRHPLAVIGLWVVLVVAGFTAGNGVFARLTATVGTVPGSESDKAATLAAGKGLVRPEINAILSGPRTTDPRYRSQINSALRDIRAIP
ncbi:MAG TPA: hypothetical protein VHC49_13745, partial [Mycobacteriales bacterium]|nr:hypothetical protein [Mycobacteriales bacterium]